MCTKLFEPKVDYIFKNLFGSEKHPKILISFLNACIKSESPIVEVHLKNTEVTKEYIEDSFSRLDVLAKTDKGEIINIEMQRADEKNMVKRSLYYWSKAFSGEYTGKSRYSELPRTICINILDFELLLEKNYHNKYLLKNEKTENILTDTMEIHFIELPKLKDIDIKDVLSMWTAFINDPNEAERYRMRQNAMNERMNALLEAEDKGIVKGIQRGIEQGIKQGIKQGIEQGAKKEKLSNAKNLLGLIPDETIAEKIGLTLAEVQSLKKLQDK
ncbi:MAG: Rpn family recombination-promoting nuclease/putative transposase [Fusobacteriaceae bacterium]